jgi:heavy metal efflux system protein
MENAIHRLEEHPTGRSSAETIRSAAHDVARPMVFGIVIIIAVYIPIFFLEGLEGRMFRPMAFTVCSALFGSLFLALIVIPSLASFAFPKGLPVNRQSTRRSWMDKITQRYIAMLEAVLRHRKPALASALVVLGIALSSLAYIGTEFMPRLDEGSILIETRKLPGISLTDSIEISRRIEKMLRTFPEIADVTIKIGRPDFATEAMGINEGDTYLTLRPMRSWTRFHSKDELIDALGKELAKIPGLNYDFTQPMAMRVDETVSGVKADLAIKIFGDDFGTLDNLAEQVVRVVGAVRGAADPQIELTSGVAELAIRVRRDQLARYGLNVKDVQQAVEAGASGSDISEIIEGQKRYSVALKLPASYRRNPEAMRDILLHAPNGEQVTIGQIADVTVTRAAQVINREEGQRRLVVMSNVRGRDLGSFVGDVQDRIRRDVNLPPGYSISYGGQFENQQRATRRLMLIVPVVIGIIFLLLYLTFHSLKQSLLVVGNIPFALVGGIAALWIRGMNLNLSASIGFIALFGVAMLNGVVLVSAINRLRGAGESTYRAVIEGARNRLRPVLMTACVASFGFIPMAISTSTGAEVQRPLASVVIGGLFSSTILTLFLLPTMYEWVFQRESPVVKAIDHVSEGMSV